MGGAAVGGVDRDARAGCGNGRSVERDRVAAADRVAVVVVEFDLPDGQAGDVLSDRAVGIDGGQEACGVADAVGDAGRPVRTVAPVPVAV